MTNQKHSGYYMQRILNLLPNDYSKIQSKELVTIARTPVYKKSKNGDKKERKGIGPNTLFFYLDRLIKKGLVNKLPVDPEHPKDVYYTRCQNPEAVIITEEAIDRVKKMFEEFPKEIERMIELELAVHREHIGGMSKEEENRVIMQISQDQNEIEYRFGRLLLRKALDFIEDSVPSLKGKDYYINSNLNFAPKKLVDERITQEERTKFL